MWQYDWFLFKFIIILTVSRFIPRRGLGTVETFFVGTVETVYFLKFSCFLDAKGTPKEDYERSG